MSNSSRPSILISNDDGIQAPGIHALIEVAKEFGDVTVVAPDGPQSGMGHAISIGKPLRMYKESLPMGLVGYACTGTPADCIKLATGVLLDDDPDIILSGINHGANSSVSSIYSGTLSAAREGALQGIPAIGFSHLDYSHEADMTAAKAVVRSILTKTFEKQPSRGYFLNVNIPKLPLNEIQGIRVTRQAIGRWVEEFDQRTDPYGQPYYWLTGKFELQDEGQDTDEYALAQGFVSATPMHQDQTAHHLIPDYSTWRFELQSPQPNS
ncbi:MAG: 5'/3'-nucleotidase SurE [Bacteroidota bacterium]